jgi:hypothetical protein
MLSRSFTPGCGGCMLLDGCCERRATRGTTGCTGADTNPRINPRASACLAQIARTMNWRMFIAHQLLPTRANLNSPHRFPSGLPTRPHGRLAGTDPQVRLRQTPGGIEVTVTLAWSSARGVFPPARCACGPPLIGTPHRTGPLGHPAAASLRSCPSQRSARCQSASGTLLQACLGQLPVSSVVEAGNSREAAAAC